MTDSERKQEPQRFVILPYRTGQTVVVSKWKPVTGTVTTPTCMREAAAWQDAASRLEAQEKGKVSE